MLEGSMALLKAKKEKQASKEHIGIKQEPTMLYKFQNGFVKPQKQRKHGSSSYARCIPRLPLWPEEVLNLISAYKTILGTHHALQELKWLSLASLAMETVRFPRLKVGKWKIYGPNRLI